MGDPIACDKWAQGRLLSLGYRYSLACVCNVPTVGLLRLTQEYQLMDFVEIGKLDVS